MTDLRQILELETIEENLYRANTVFAEDYSLYGGQVAAQALLAAGRTVDPARRPHSLHGYFLRQGDSRIPTVFKVFRDRDGRSFSARRVVAIQRGEVILNMSASFHLFADGPRAQVEAGPLVPPPDECAPYEVERLFDYEVRLPPQPYQGQWPTRFWSRASVPFAADPLLQAGVLTYFSDFSTAVQPDPDGRAQPGSSLDHAVWFHDELDVNAWQLVELAPRVAGHGRGWYTGSIFAADGRLLAGLAQECLFR